MKRFIMLLLIGVLLVGASGQYKKITGETTAYLTVSDLGDTLMFYYVEEIAAGDVDDSSWYVDTILGDSIAYVTPAKIITITPTTAMDSFLYYDSVDATVDAGADTISWRSPLFVMRLTPVLEATGAYTFDVVYASGDTAGFDWTATSVTTVAALIDTLIDSLTGIAGLNDSITFEDSVTYIKATALYSTETHGGRWSVRSDPALDPRMSPRTGGRIVQSEPVANTSIAMICDSMVLRHNAKATTGDSVLATDYGTHYTLSTKEGSQANTLNLPSGWSVTVLDSAQDTLTTQYATIASVVQGMVAAINATATVTDTAEAFSDADTAYSVISRRHKRFVMTTDDRFTITDSNATTDTVFGTSSVTDSIYIGNLEGFTAMHGYVKIHAATGRTGLGADDSLEIWVSSDGPAGNWVITNLDTVAIPVSLSTVVLTGTKGDSLLSEALYIKYNYYDTISDTSGVELPFLIQWDYLLK